MDWDSKRVLVTGSSGVIGRVLVDLLSQRDAEILSVDKESDSTIEPEVNHIQVDLSREVPSELRDFDPHVVMHLAAEFERTSERPGYWKVSFDNNPLLSNKLLRTLEGASSLETYVFASSYLIYDSSLYTDVSGVYSIHEDDRISPRNMVGVGKYYTEKEISFASNTSDKFRSVLPRIYRVYGRGSRDVISRWIRSAIREEPIEVYGESNQFDYVFAGDVAEGLMRLAEAENASGVVNLATGRGQSISKVVAILKDIFPNLEVETVENSHPVESSEADMCRFKELTDWCPSTDLEEGIRKVVQFERSQINYSGA
ncbi:NAD-dependent epimerase/dehydratase family protein [Salinibacter ruber]|uniref:NAD-dependent epimerase/dehydratase family protein n=1 Tax=Salinibacter ruber TaxID=146919 RepID=UPI002073E92A|nr:NAD-dependent epimerase/dehydratase family protein [Salinibacter ruber]